LHDCKTSASIKEWLIKMSSSTSNKRQHKILVSSLCRNGSVPKALSPQDKIKVQISCFVARDKCGCVWLAFYLHPRRAPLSSRAPRFRDNPFLSCYWIILNPLQQNSPRKGRQIRRLHNTRSTLHTHTARVTLFTFMLGNKDSTN
jgi:hypothetical protein